MGPAVRRQQAAAQRLRLAQAACGVGATYIPGQATIALRRLVRVPAWLQAAILTIYGLVLIIAGLLVQPGVIAAAASADHRALAWHVYLWDPWFLLWGVLVTAALTGSRPPSAAPIARGR